MRILLEEEILLLCICAERDSRQQAWLQRLLSDGKVDLQHFWIGATQQQVSPLVAYSLTTAPLDKTLPSPVVRDAKDVRWKTLSYNMALHAELGTIGKSLRARDIPAVPLKGTCLAERLYNALDARQTGDIDVLVPESQLDTARSVLRELGYELLSTDLAQLANHPFHGIPWIRKTPFIEFVVELHWGLNNPRFVTIDYQDLWQRILANSSEQDVLRSLPSQEELLFLTIHLCRHICENQYGALRLLADIDRLIRRSGEHLDWAYVVALAKRWNVAGMLYFTLCRAQLFFDTPLNQAALEQLRPVVWRRMLVALLAPPRAMLRPGRSERLHRKRFRLAYCALVSPLRRSVAAYLYYVYWPSWWQRPSLLSRMAGTARGVCGGIIWTGLAFGSALVDWVRAVTAEALGSTARALASLTLHTLA